MVADHILRLPYLDKWLPQRSISSLRNTTFRSSGPGEKVDASNVGSEEGVIENTLCAQWITRFPFALRGELLRSSTILTSIDNGMRLRKGRFQKHISPGGFNKAYWGAEGIS